MRDLLHLIRSELRRLSKTPSVPLLWLAFPLGLSLIEYGAFGHLGSGTGLPKGTLLLVDRDGSALSGILKAGLQREPMSKFFTVVDLEDEKLIRKQFETGDASAALVVPKGFQDSVFVGGPVDFAYTPNPRQVIRPKMTEATLRTFLEIANRLIHEAEVPLQDIRRRTLQAAGVPDRESFLSISAGFYDAGQKLGKMRQLRNLEIDTQRPSKNPASAGNATNFFAYFLPGLMLFSLLLVGQGFERRFFQVRKQGLARRVAASPVRRGTVLGAEFLSTLAGTCACAVIVLVLGALLFHIPLRNPLVVALSVLGFSLFSAGLSKSIFARAKNERAAAALASVLTLVTTLVGGGFAPVEIYSASVQPFARATPVGTASQTLVDVLVHGADLAKVAPYLAGTWAWGIGLCVLGLALAWRSHESA